MLPSLLPRLLSLPRSLNPFSKRSSFQQQKSKYLPLYFLTSGDYDSNAMNYNQEEKDVKKALCIKLT